MPKLKLHWQILLALVLAVLAGSITGQDMAVAGLKVYDVYAFVGTLFLNALKMLVVPLIISSIVAGMAGLGPRAGFGRLGGKTLAYYLSTSFLAICVGLVLVNVLSPGIVDGQPAREVLGLSADTQTVMAKVEGKGGGDIVGIFLRMVPTNVVQAAADGQMLGLIFFSLLIGLAINELGTKHRNAQHDFWESFFQMMMKLTDWVMALAPIGVFALVAKVAASTDVGAIRPLAMFFITVLAALAIHFLGTMALLLWTVGKVNPLRHYQAMAPALLMAWSSASSASTLPLTLECVKKRAGVSDRVSSFTLPLGATVNMDGTALYECVAALFIAQAYGLDITVGTQFTVVAIALLTSIGVAGIPAASLVAIVIILTAIGLPAEGIGLIIAVDRILDMCRTAVNVFGDSCGAVIIAKSEGEKKVLAAPAASKG